MIFLFKKNLFLCSLLLMVGVMLGKDFFLGEKYMLVFNFYLFNSLSLSFPILIDLYSVLFSFTVLFISGNIMKFSTFYMADEAYKTRFLLTLLLFIFSMLFLIFVPNLVFLMIGWDGLGMSSFYLIMYYQNSRSLGASMMTLLSNRVGDLCLLLSIGLFFSLGLSFLNSMVVLGVFILVACFTKSAQFPFMSWLPAAMAAPTPVSALVHSSTLVTAGVYLMIRFSTVIFSNESIVLLVASISSMTMFFSALSGMFETDFKKIIALSTLSQLGFMMFSLSQMMKMCSFFHLITHAIFKSLLFICAGAVIILSGHNQDIRALPKFNNLIIQSCFIIASLALMSTPFMVGFYSKDLLLELFFQNQTKNWFLVLVVFLSSWLTVAYSIRMMYLSMWQTPNFKLSLKFDLGELKPMYSAVISSALMSVFAGAGLSWIFSFETKYFIPELLSAEMFFICSFILLGAGVSFIMSFFRPPFMMLHMVFLTPLLQKTPESVFQFSKKLYCFSDLAWLEKSSFVVSVDYLLSMSSVSFVLIKGKPLIAQMFVVLVVFSLVMCL